MLCLLHLSIRDHNLLKSIIPQHPDDHFHKQDESVFVETIFKLSHWILLIESILRILQLRHRNLLIVNISQFLFGLLHKQDESVSDYTRIWLYSFISYWPCLSYSSFTSDVTIHWVQKFHNFNSTICTGMMNWYQAFLQLDMNHLHFADWFDLTPSLDSISQLTDSKYFTTSRLSPPQAKWIGLFWYWNWIWNI